MSKKSKKASKKTDVADKCEPIKTRMQIIFENYLHSDSLTLSQQKFIVSSLSLRNDSLYDSIIIDIITDILRFFKQLSLTAIQSEPIYYIVQNLLYKLMNDHNCNLDKLNNYLHKQLLQRIKVENPEQNNDEQTTEYISSEISQKIICFLEERILSQYELYRIALFENNPSHIKYIQFKKEFNIGDMIRFQDTDCMFKIAEFRLNDIVLNCLHNDFKSINIENENDKDLDINYYISRDQLQFISFVPETEQQVEINQTADDDNKNENEEVSNKDNKENEEIDDKKDMSNEINTESSVVDEICANKNDEKRTINVIKESPKTLIDVIVDKKVQDKLKLMQQKFDKELEEYKQQIEILNNVTRSNDTE
eukprot:41495_1